ncbi:MAG: squalene--hopene cyclase [Verrucomicrobiales bacterium]|nr:squalene--hopene cyclase [Verrucomicrobiales bacterium]MCP5526935.1 squalene--hopene cyclase [Verrucomicrobiales bacterium]
MTPDLHQRIRAAHRKVADALLAELSPAGHWVGELSSSALSTATAVTALATVGRTGDADHVRKGLEWLAAHANPDGGWGDTVRSRSNLSTTALAWAAFGAAGADETFASTVTNTARYISEKAGAIERLVPAIEALYGKDRTFSVPITMTLALSGRLGPDGWREVRPLPFELAALPRGLFGALRLPVVSYALPALIAIGQVIHQRSGRFHPLRSFTRERTLDVLTTLQPANGGFLEATPLTSFVTMSLAGMGLAEHPVAQRGAAFLRQSVRPDGSWPIDTNLATWGTTLAIKALRHTCETLADGQRATLRAWLLGQQYRAVHPYTGAAPGGWAWTDLPGGVPDADDTAGALLALRCLSEPDDETRAAAARGVKWLLDLQNRDGGMPTFCRGWGALPFDRSTPELTAHALRAWAAWLSELPSELAARIQSARSRATAYLRTAQRPDGAWLPLWFGNEAAPRQENPVYGTAQVLLGTASERALAAARDRGRTFVVAQQNEDGGWGGARDTPSTMEETALSLEALTDGPEHQAAIDAGTRWLLQAVEAGAWHAPAPIGLYFARLWYFERLYPLVFTTSAFGQLASIVCQAASG